MDDLRTLVCGLSPETLNAKIAKIVHPDLEVVWLDRYGCGVSPYWIERDNEPGDTVSIIGGWREYIDGEEKYIAVVPPYAQKNDQALWLTEQQDGYFFLTRTNSTHWRPGPWGPIHWECGFAAPGNFTVMANNAALAIARAFLLYHLIHEKDKTND